MHYQLINLTLLVYKMSKKLIPLLLVSGILYLNFVQKDNPKKTLAPDPKTEKIYTQYCSSCHGEKVEAFVDRTW